MTELEAIQQNLCGHVSSIARQAAGMTVLDTPDLLLADSGLPADTFNVVTRARRATPAFGANVAAAIGHFRSRGLPFAWWVVPGYGPDTLVTELVAAGLGGPDEETGMTARLDRLVPPALPAALSVRRVATAQELDAFASVLAALSDPPDPWVTAFYRQGARVVLGADSSVRCFTGYAGGEPVGSSLTFLDDGVAGIYNVATLPRVRGRGFGEMMTWAALADARDAGCTLAVLQASGGAERLYARLGFRACGAVSVYHWAP